MSGRASRDWVHEHFAKHPGPVRPRLVCADGYRMSVQASHMHYCTPRTYEGPWAAVEVWCCERPDGSAWRIPGLSQREPAGWVPVERVNRLIERHGGLADTCN